jgi:hypothetical protein
MHKTSYLTILLWCISFRREISRMAVLGTPSSSCSSRIFLRAIVSFVRRSLALYTTPYVPSPIFSTFSYCHQVCKHLSDYHLYSGSTTFWSQDAPMVLLQEAPYISKISKRVRLDLVMVTALLEDMFSNMYCSWMKLETQNCSTRERCTAQSYSPQHYDQFTTPIFLKHACTVLWWHIEMNDMLWSDSNITCSGQKRLHQFLSQHSKMSNHKNIKYQ